MHRQVSFTEGQAGLLKGSLRMRWKTFGSGALLLCLILRYGNLVKGDDVTDAMEMSEAAKEADTCPVSEYGSILIPHLISFSGCFNAAIYVCSAMSTKILAIGCSSLWLSQTEDGEIEITFTFRILKSSRFCCLFRYDKLANDCVTSCRAIRNKLDMCLKGKHANICWGYCYRQVVGETKPRANMNYFKSTEWVFLQLLLPSWNTISFFLILSPQ